MLKCDGGRRLLNNGQLLLLSIASVIEEEKGNRKGVCAGATSDIGVVLRRQLRDWRAMTNTNDVKSFLYAWCGQRKLLRPQSVHSNHSVLFFDLCSRFSRKNENALI